MKFQLKMMQEETENGLISIKEIEVVIKNLPLKNKANNKNPPGPGDFIGQLF